MTRQNRAHVTLGLLLASIIAAGPALAEDELVTDRPDQTESSETVAPGKVQVETGWTFSRDDEGGVERETHEAPGTLVRIGLHERLELRLGWRGLIDERFTFAGPVPGRRLDADGVGDADVGVKVRLLRGDDGDNGGPAVALIAATSVPVGDDAFTTDAYDPALRLTVAHDLSERLALAYNVGVEWETAPDPGGLDDSRLSRYVYTVALGIGLSDRWGTFVELYGDFGGSAGGPPAHAFDAGLTYLLDDAVQLDFAAGVGLSDAADDFFVGLGVSFRLPR